jgi:hypothetical protein
MRHNASRTGLSEEQTNGFFELIANLSIADRADPLKIGFHNEMLAVPVNRWIDAITCVPSVRTWYSDASLLDGHILSLDFGRHGWLNSGHREPKRLAGNMLVPFERVSGCLVYQEANIAG